MTTEARVRWVEGKRFVGVASSGHAIVVDAEREVGTSPMELLLVGLAGCTASDVLEILRKKRQAVAGVEVCARAERAETPPRVYTEIHVEYVVRGRGITPKAVEAAIQLSTGKYCSATAMLGKAARITTSHRIEEEGQD